MLKKRWLIMLAVVFLSSGLIAGCSGQKKEAAQKPAGEEKMKAPPALKKIKDDIDKINEELAKKMVKEDSNKQKSKDTGAGSEGQNDSSKGKISGEEKKLKENDYRKEKEILQKMYKEWNALEPDLVKAGVGSKKRDSFRKGLDELARAVEKKKKEEAVMAGISMYKYYAGISRDFGGVVPANFYLVKYEALMSAALAGKGDFAEAQKHMPSLSEYWNMLKMQKKKGEDDKLFDRTELSLNDLQEAIEEKESLLISMKIKVVDDNLKAVEESLSKM